VTLWARKQGPAGRRTTVTTDEIDIVAAGINHQTWYVRRSGATST
jgi:alpha-galactosidase